MKTVFHTTLGLMASAFVTLAVAFWATGPAAHEGSHVSRIVSDVSQLKVIGSEMLLSLTVTNFSETDVVLQSVWATGAEATAIAPVSIEQGAAQLVEVTFVFSSSIPSIFTAVLDFGVNGQGPVLVMK
ncbi:MAG: hypothetical protein JXQ85_08305 [Cognatishimia sp.]|uniref:hypothetical protein n=1 Tax=Cognatishimia sp. TaxID=2211648 RepID=UPI003B8DBDA7